MAEPWDLQGVTVKVELSTSGELIGTPTPPLSLHPNSSGTNATPPGWQRDPTNMYVEWTPTQIGMIAGKGVGQQNLGWLKYAFTTGSGQIVVGRSYRFFVSMRNWVAVATSNQRARGSLGIVQTRSNGTVIAGTSTSTPHGNLLDAYVDVAVITAPIHPECTTLTVHVFLDGQGSIPTGQYGLQFMGASLTDLDAPGTMPVILWRDITCDVQEINIRYGRDKFTARYDVATMSVKLDNRDGDYRFMNPHPFNFRPGRLVRVIAYRAATTYPLAYMVIDSIKDTYEMDGGQNVTVSCLDVTSLLGQTIVPQTSFGAVPNPPAGDAVNALINLVDYPYKSIGAGAWRVTNPIPATTSSIRDTIGIVADGEGGAFLAGKSGTMVFWDRNYTEVSWTQVGTTFLATRYDDPIIISDGIPNRSFHTFICPNELGTEWNQDRIINQANLGRIGGVPVTVNNTDSQKAYGVKAYSQTNLFLYYDADVLARAAELVQANATADYRVTRLSWNPIANPGSWNNTLTMFLNFLVRVIYHHPEHLWGFYTVTRVQSVTHRITPRTWETTVSLDQPIAYGEHAPVVPGTDPGWDVSTWDEAVWDDVITAGAIWSAGMNWSDPNTKWGE